MLQYIEQTMFWEQNRRAKTERYGDRSACVKVGISSQKPVRYEPGMLGRESLDCELEEGSFFGYGADGEVCGVYLHFIDIEQEYGSM